MPTPLVQVLLQKASTGPRKFSPDEEKLRDLWNKQAPDDLAQVSDDFEGYPKGNVLVPSHAPGFRPDVPTTGGPGVAKLLRRFLNIAPELQGKFSGVHAGPTAGSMQVLQASGFNPEDYPITNLLGTTTRSTGQISLNPRIMNDPNYLTGTLAHELTHASGYGETGATKAEAPGHNIGMTLFDVLSRRGK